MTKCQECIVRRLRELGRCATPTELKEHCANPKVDARLRECSSATLHRDLRRLVANGVLVRIEVPILGLKRKKVKYCLKMRARTLKMGELTSVEAPRLVPHLVPLKEPNFHY